MRKASPELQQRKNNTEGKQLQQTIYTETIHLNNIPTTRRIKPNTDRKNIAHSYRDRIRKRGEQPRLLSTRNLIGNIKSIFFIWFSNGRIFRIYIRYSVIFCPIYIYYLYNLISMFITFILLMSVTKYVVFMSLMNLFISFQ